MVRKSLLERFLIQILLQYLYQIFLLWLVTVLRLLHKIIEFHPILERSDLLRLSFYLIFHYTFFFFKHFQFCFDIKHLFIQILIFELSFCFFLHGNINFYRYINSNLSRKDNIEFITEISKIKDFFLFLIILNDHRLGNII